MKQNINREVIPPSTDDTLILPTYADKLGFQVPPEVYNFSISSK